MLIRKFGRLLAILFAVALFATACGSDAADTASAATGGDDTPAATAVPEVEEPVDEAPALTGDPVKIGLIAQDEELFSFPEVRAGAQAYADYLNAEAGGIDGSPVELVVCGAGDAPESHVACAQQFVNDDSVHIVINAGFAANSASSNELLSGAGKATMTLGNDFGDYLTPGVFTFDPGLLGLAQVFFVFASENRGVTTMSLFIADDPSLLPFIPVLEAIADANGITITESIPLGFEPDLTGPVSAADTANEGWVFVLGDGAQCTAASSAVATVGYEGELFANDLCLSQDIVESGAVDGYAGPVVSSLPTADGGADVAELVRILDTYGDSNTQLAGLSGWAVANVHIAAEVMANAGGAGADDAAALNALGKYSSSDVPGFPAVQCPGAGAFAGGCNQAPLMVTIVDGQMTQPDGFVQLDFTELEFLLEG